MYIIFFLLRLLRFWWLEYNDNSCALYITDQARVVLYKRRQPVKELEFDAKGSNNLNWFKFARLTVTENAWSDMATQPRNLFTIQAGIKRSFISSSEYGNHCAGDKGWMLITGTYSDWERRHGQNSVIYSTVTGRTNWRNYSK